MTTANSFPAEKPAKPSLDGWSPAAVDKAVIHELVTQAIRRAASYYPEHLPGLIALCERTRPVRLSESGRFLRAWGRDFFFSAEESILVKKIVAAFNDGLRVTTGPKDALKGHPAMAEGIIQHADGCYRLQEPLEEINRPVFVTFTADSDPYAGIEKEALALAWLQMHPEWSDEQIAAKIGISRTSIYRFERYKAARALLREGRRDYMENQLTERGGGQAGLRMRAAAARANES